MTAPFFAEHDVTLYQGDVREVLATMEPESVNCVVTSPPYYGLRDYGVDGQLGLEPSPAEYVETMREVFAEVRRVLRPDGTLWLNLGDSYAAGASMTGTKSMRQRLNSSHERHKSIARGIAGLPPKNLLGVPWRVAFALQDDGWILRNAIVWSKPNAMPESVTDRLSTRYEHVFLFTRSRRYWFDLDPIREPHAEKSLYQQKVARRRPHAIGKAGTAVVPGERAQSGMAAGARELNGNGANPGDVWTIPTTPYPGAHFATFPPELPRRCIKAGCPPGGIVLDPFAGSGTTLMVAREQLRDSIGIELSPASCDLIVDRIGQPVFDFDATS